MFIVFEVESLWFGECNHVPLGASQNESLWRGGCICGLLGDTFVYMVVADCCA